VSRARHWLRRAVLSALAGGGLTAAGVGGSLTGAQAAEAPTGTSTDTQPPASLSPPTEHEERSTSTTTTTTATTPTTPAPAPSAATGSGTAQQQPTTTSTTPSPPSPKPSAPKSVHQDEQPSTSTNATQGKPATPAVSKPTGGTQPGNPAASNGSAAAGNIAPAPQLLASGALLPSPLLSGSLASIQALGFYRIPLFLLPIYKAASAQYGVPWQVLAAINEVETDYGTDLSVSTAGAVGWMQFMPETWLQYGVDAVNAGYADPYNPIDAIFAAARYLRAAGASSNLTEAIFAYNHSQAYVQSVLLRARLIASYPTSVMATLTGLTEGSLPAPGAKLLAVPRSLVQAPAGGAPAGGSASAGSGHGDSRTKASTSSLPGSTPAPSPASTVAASQRHEEAPAPLSQLSELAAPRDAPVLAVEDGRIVALGRSRSLGDYVVLRDTYGDVFTYASLGSIAPSFHLPKPVELTIPKGAVRGAEGPGPAPKQAATGGQQTPLTLHVTVKAPVGGFATSAAWGTESPVPPTQAGAGKVRVFAHPGNRDALAAAHRRASHSKRTPASSHALRRGSVVAQGTVLGHVGSTDEASSQGMLRFAVRPAGAQLAIDPGPILRNWGQLDAALHPEGAKAGDVLAGATAADAFNLTAAQLERAVLADPGIRLGACDRQQVASGKVDQRALALLVFMSRSGLKPTVEQLRCGRLTQVGGAKAVSYLPQGALAISSINGVPIAGHQGQGSITDVTIRTLLTVKHPFAPAQIISLMQYPGVTRTVARPDHAGELEIVLAAKPRTGHLARTASAVSTPADTVLDSAQWDKLIAQIGGIVSPKVSRKPSSASIRDRKVG
jgi:soluble lytic murein transglycosylase-like protein